MPQSIDHDGDQITEPIVQPSSKGKNTPSFPESHVSTVVKKHLSLERLNPTHDSRHRKSSRLVAIFNLVATVCGGGVLSLPLVFSIAGIVPTIILMIFAAVTSNFSLYLLCICARRTEAKSFGDVAHHAFGPVAEVGTTVILFATLSLILVAYMVLAKDIWTPLVFFAIDIEGYGKGAVASGKGAVASKWVLLALLTTASPLFLKRDLHALRHTCYVGFFSLVVLAFALVSRSVQQNFIVNPTLFEEEAIIYTKSFSDLIYVFPIISLSFLSSFNVLSVHSALIKPTRKRVKFVLDGAVGTCLLFFVLVGLCGYLYAYCETKDNILLNFDVTDRAVLFGRIGYAFTLMFAMPLVLLPCRDALLSIPEQWMKSRDVESQGPPKHINYREDEQSPLLPLVEEGKCITCGNSMESTDLFSPRNPKKLSKMTSEVVDDWIALKEEQLESMAPPTSNENMDTSSGSSSREQAIHAGSTLCILVLCYVAAVAVPGVATVWSFCGSSMGILIQFIIPSACYIKIRARKGLTSRSFWAWILLFFSCAAAVVCTVQAVKKAQG